MAESESKMQGKAHFLAFSDYPLQILPKKETQELLEAPKDMLMLQVQKTPLDRDGTEYAQQVLITWYWFILLNLGYCLVDVFCLRHAKDEKQVG